MQGAGVLGGGELQSRGRGGGWCGDGICGVGSAVIEGGAGRDPGNVDRQIVVAIDRRRDDGEADRGALVAAGGEDGAGENGGLGDRGGGDRDGGAPGGSGRAARGGRGEIAGGGVAV